MPPKPKPRKRQSQSHRDAVQAVTQTAYARGRGFSRQAIRKAIETGRIRPGSLRRGGKIDPRAADRDLAENTDATKVRDRSKGGSRGAKASEQTLNQAKTRREIALADLAELDLAQARGNSVLRSEVKTAADECARLVKERVLAVPERVMDGLERLGVRDVVSAHQLLTGELRQALESLAADLESGAPAPAAAAPETPASTAEPAA